MHRVRTGVEGPLVRFEPEMNHESGMEAHGASGLGERG